MAVTDDLSASQVRTLLNVEDGSEANNISNANVTDLTDSGLATLYYHKLLLPFGTHIDLNPFSATNKYPYSVTIDLSITLVKWTQAFKVLTTDNAAHYWKIGMYRWSDNALVDEITTATATANATLQVSTITFDISSLTTSDIGLYILLTNVNSPGDFYTLVPAVELS